MTASGRGRSDQLHQQLDERSFQSQLVRVAELTGWWVFHDRDSRGNRAGLPDLILIRPPRVVFIELKREKGRIRQSQAVVLEMLSRCPGVEAYLWRPSDWDAAVEVLRRR